MVTRGWREGGPVGGAQKILKAGTLFYVILQLWIYAILHSAKPIECTVRRANPYMNHGP